MDTSVWSDLEDWPSSFTCPITLEVMRDPTMLRQTGHTFEREVIEQHLARHKRCPLSNIELIDCTLVPNHALRQAIEDHAALLSKLKARSAAPPLPPPPIPAAPPQPLPPPDDGRTPSVGAGGGLGVWEIEPRRIRLAEMLGRGSQGEVYSGELLNPDESSMPVAIKVVKLQGSERGLLDEVSLMQRATVSCDHVCRLVGVCKARDNIFMIMKLYGLNLAQLAESHQDGKLPLFKCCRYATQICKAMVGLHRQNILSLDLKPQNVLWDSDTDSVVVADFGISRQVGSNASLNPQGDFIGSPAYSAPEVWSGSSISTKADVWSFGCTLLEVAGGSKPWQGLQVAEIRRRILDVRESPSHVHVSGDLGSVIRSCLQHDPGSRPSFSDLLATLEGMVEGLRTKGGGSDGTMLGTITNLAISRLEKFVLSDDSAGGGGGGVGGGVVAGSNGDAVGGRVDPGSRVLSALSLSVARNSKVQELVQSSKVKGILGGVEAAYGHGKAAAAAASKFYGQAKEVDKKHKITETTGSMLYSAAVFAGHAARKHLTKAPQEGVQHEAAQESEGVQHEGAHEGAQRPGAPSAHLMPPAGNAPPQRTPPLPPHPQRAPPPPPPQGRR